MDKAGQHRSFACAFQSKPGKVHAKFNNFEQLYVTLTSADKEACLNRGVLFNFLLQFRHAVAFFHLKRMNLHRLLVAAVWLR
jgi:hypothetical protein